MAPTFAQLILSKCFRVAHQQWFIANVWLMKDTFWRKMGSIDIENILIEAWIRPKLAMAYNTSIHSPELTKYKQAMQPIPSIVSTWIQVLQGIDLFIAMRCTENIFVYFR